MVQFDTLKANLLLERAILAWQWAEENSNDYNEDSLVSLQYRATYAAAELFKTTGDEIYELRFQETSPFAGGQLDYRWSKWNVVWGGIVPYMLTQLPRMLIKITRRLLRHF